MIARCSAVAHSEGIKAYNAVAEWHARGGGVVGAAARSGVSASASASRSADAGVWRDDLLSRGAWRCCV